MLKAENGKPILLKNPYACLLVKRRAIAEDRSIERTLKLTIIESLSGKYGKSDDIGQPQILQGNSAAIIPDAEGN